MVEALRDRAGPTVDTQRVRSQMDELLSSVGRELYNGRAVPISVRRAALGLAGALREALQPVDDSGA